jgi:acetolactate decarboxylase
MPELNCALSNGLWEHLQEYSKKTQQPVAHIVSKALADLFEIPYHTMFQVSTATALVEGIYQGAVRVATLREHGDLGLDTFEGLDGEMVIVDGRFFQVRSDDNVLSPYALITTFAPEPAVTLEECPDLAHLTSRFDTLRHSDNVFFALRLDGKFDYVHTRAMHGTKETLVQAASVQPEFEFHDVAGTLVGFWSPEYVKTLNVPGYHLHFISTDRTHGGHLLQCSGRGYRFSVRGIITSQCQKLQIF